MQDDHPAKEKLYRAYKRGDPNSLFELLESERERLYDFLLRMTGQMSRSVETIDEVYQTLDGDTLEAIETYAELRLCLYTTARKFNADIWNADTARLVNAATDDRSAALDKAVRMLSGPEREAMLLRLQAGFGLEDIGEIMAVSEHVAESLYEVGLARLADAVPGAGDAELRNLPTHPLPPRSSHATVNLSMVMQGIKAKPVGLRSPVRLALVAAAVLLAGAWHFYPELVARALAAVRSLATGSRGGD